jgi:predicted HicB family RNase H-like nuclease
MKIQKYSKPLTIALHPEAYKQIKQITDIKQVSMAEWVRDAIENALPTFKWLLQNRV